VEGIREPATAHPRAALRELEIEARPIWSALVALYPPFERYQARTRRRIPVIQLQPMAG
jgi:hypothetical protein